MKLLMLAGVVLIVAALAGCGRDVPTSPNCPAIAANFVRTDTLYFAQGTLPDGSAAPKIVAYLMDIFACNGADVGHRRTP